MAFQSFAGFTSAIATDPAATAAGYLTPTRYNLAHTYTGVVSGGIQYGTSTTTVDYSALLAANSVVIGGGAGAAPFTSANLTFSATGSPGSGPFLQVGSSSTTSVGGAIGYSQFSGYGNLWLGAYSGGSVPTTGNFSLQANASDLRVNAPSVTGKIDFAIGNSVIKITQVGTAGAGPAITAGTATTDVNATSVTQTWNAAGVTFTHERHVITDTASAAGSLAVQYLGGAAGATNLFKVSKAGLVDAPAYAVAGGAGASFGPGLPTSITVVNGIVTAIS